MQDQLKQIFSAPTFDNKRQTQLASFINVALLAIIFSTFALLLVAIITSNPMAQSVRLKFIIVMNIALKVLLHRKKLQIVSAILLLIVWLNITVSAFNADGIYAPVIGAYTIIIILSGIFYKQYAILIATIVSILSSFGLVYGMQLGVIYTPPQTLREPMLVWFIYTTVFTISGILVYVSARVVQQSIQESEAIASELQRSSENLRRAESLASLGNFEYDAQTQTIKWSDEIYQIFGEEPGKPITVTDYENFLTVETREQLKQKLYEAISIDQSFNLEHSLVLQNGIKKDIHTIGYPVTDENGQTAKIFGIIQDVTTRKRAEHIQEVLFNISRARHETTQLRDLLHYVVEQLSHLIYIPSCYVALYDEKSQLYSFPYGFDQHDLDWSPRRLDQTRTDAIRRTGQARMFTEGDYQIDTDVEVTRVEGELSKVWLGAPLKIQQRVIGVIAIQDYNNTYAYQQTDLDLLAYVAENIASVIYSKQAETEHLELQIQKEKNTFLQEFISHMTHDLKTPLSVIKNSSDLMRMVKDPTRQKEYIERINYQLERLDKMIEDILTISRLDHLQRSDYAFIDLNALLHHTTQQLYPKIQQKNLQLNLELTPDLPHIMGVEADLTRAILNLLENAANYTQAYGQITVRTYPEDNFVCCEIKDTGIGIHPNDVANIFDRFFRADNARDFERGTGLGLAIVSRIIELHSGTIHVESQLGIGTVFTIRLTKRLTFQKSTA